MAAEQNEHETIIKNTVFHTFPYSMMIPNFEGPHAEDCGGCIINAEVEKLVAELNRLSPVKEIIAELEAAKKKIETLTEDRRKAFFIANRPDEGAVAGLVAVLVSERDQLDHVRKTIESTLKKLVVSLGNYESGAHGRT